MFRRDPVRNRRCLYIMRTLLLPVQLLLVTPRCERGSHVKVIAAKLRIERHENGVVPGGHTDLTPGA